VVVLQMENCTSHQRQLIARVFVVRNALLSISASIFLLIAHAVRADTALAETAQLQLKPNRCVALHQGQVCYQNVQLSWSANQLGNYCLYQQYSEAPVYCWQSVAAGQYHYEFASDASVQLRLVNMQTSNTVATATVEVAWVYKANTRRKTHWRLF